MAVIRPFENTVPTIAESVFVADTASIIGDVHIGPRSSIWFGTTLRGDVFPIRIGADVSVQDNTVVHVTAGEHQTTVGDRVTIGHAAIIHGCTIHDDCLVGMGAIVMDGAVVESNTIVGAGSLVTPGTVIPEGHLAVGAPARPRRKLTNEELQAIRDSAAHYVDLAGRYVQSRSSAPRG